MLYYNYENAINGGYYFADYLTGSNPYITPENPVREGYTFTGWYLDEGCTEEWDGAVPKSTSEKIEVYAGWQEK